MKEINDTVAYEHNEGMFYDGADGLACKPWNPLLVGSVITKLERTYGRDGN